MANFRPHEQQRWDRAGGSLRDGDFSSAGHRAGHRDGATSHRYHDPGRSDGQNWRQSRDERRSYGEREEARRYFDTLGDDAGGRDVSSKEKKEKFIDRSKPYHRLLEGVMMEKLDENGWVILDRKRLRFKYFQDRNKIWPFWCREDGANLLYEVFKALAPCLRQSADVDDRVILEGEQLYSQKPNLGGQGVAWSQEEYSHPGLQRQYVRFKSVQRFTETWSTLERAYNRGLLSLENFQDERREPLRVASLGGGPGFELLAFDLFAKRFLPERSKHLELFSLDLEPSWERYTKLLGLQFAVWDVNDGVGLLRKCPSSSSSRERGDVETPLDLAIISYVYSHYMGNKHCHDWLADSLKSGRIKAVLICSRHEYMPEHIRPMEVRGIAVISVIQEPGSQYYRQTDHRQLLFLSQEKAHSMRRPVEPIEDLTFPNVPYCEHRKGR